MKITIIISLLIISTNIVAQSALATGVYSVGGNISYSSTSREVDSDSQNEFVFSPSIGYFLINNLYTGIIISYRHYSKGDYSADLIGFGPSVRYYIINDKLSPFLGISYSYNTTTSSRDTYDNDEAEDTNTSYTLSIGADYFINEYFAIEGSIDYSFHNYEYSYSDYSGNTESKQFNIGFGAKYFVF